MQPLQRFSVSINAKLLAEFDKHIQQAGYPTRSKAIADLISESLVKQEWKGQSEVTAAIIMVYDHHKRELSNSLTHIQHNYHKLIIVSQHVHLDHDNCLEIVVTRGKPAQIEALTQQLKSVKGVKYCTLAGASTGEHI